jgi:hypothetical protein
MKVIILDPVRDSNYLDLIEFCAENLFLYLIKVLFSLASSEKTNE